MLLDMTPESIEGGFTEDRNDAPLQIGHTYHDAEAKLFVTPVARGDEPGNDYIDVVINIGDFHDNVAPAVLLGASSTDVLRDEAVQLTKERCGWVSPLHADGLLI